MSVQEIVKSTLNGQGVSQNDIIYVVTEYIREIKNRDVAVKVRQNNSIIATYDIDLLMKAYSYAEKYFKSRYGI